MTKGQNDFYWKLWAMLTRAEPGVDRKQVHTLLGLPESHLDWGNRHFDEWKAHCLSKAKPGNYRAQTKQQKMPEIRLSVFVDHLLSALGKEQSYAEGIVAQMNRRGAQGGAFLTLETLPEKGWKDLVIALKMACRRRWKTKDELLGEIHLAIQSEDYDDETARAAVEAELKGELPPRLDKLPYETLLVILSVLRRLASGGVRVAGLQPERNPF